MAILIRPAADRGHANHGWLDTNHSFSFADYYDENHMGYRSLRVLNDDLIQPGTGFPLHGHRDMEIVTYVIRGAIEHRDTTGGHGVLRRGDVQHMTAGTGIRHSEFNASASEDLRLLQMWIRPERAGLTPAYAQTRFADDSKRNALCVLVTPSSSPLKDDGAAERQPLPLAIHQDARILAALLDPQVTLEYALSPGRGAWVQMVDGSLTLNGVALQAGDGAAVDDVPALMITGTTAAEFLVLDLA